MTAAVGPTQGASSRPPVAGGPTRSIETPGSPLVPAPTDIPLDTIAQIYKLMSEQGASQSETGKETVTVRAAEKKKRMDEYYAALDRAREAAKEKHGFFDSVGIGALIGIATANPMLVLADVSTHLAGITPKAVADFERENSEKIALASDALLLMSNAALLQNALMSDPRVMAAAASIGGTLLRDTKVLGDDVSDWTGTALVVTNTPNGATAACATLSHKDGAVADTIRTSEKEAEPYTKWASYAGMALAAAGATMASFGTATFVVVAIGIALSASGVVATETHCLDGLVGKDASRWLGLGLTAAGSLITGVGAAGLGSTAMQALEATGDAAQGIATAAAGGQKLRDAAISRDVEHADADASEALHRARRIDRLMEEVIDELREIKARGQKLSKIVHTIEDTTAQTQLLAASAMKG